MVGTGSYLHHPPVLIPSDDRRAQIARETLYWDRPFKTVRAGSFETGDIVWFPEGALNASYNCVDRWVYTHPDKVGIGSPIILVVDGQLGTMMLSGVYHPDQASARIQNTFPHPCPLHYVTKSLTSLSNRLQSSTRPMSRVRVAKSPMLNFSAKSAALPMSSRVWGSGRVIPSPSTCQ